MNGKWPFYLFVLLSTIRAQCNDNKSENSEKHKCKQTASQLFANKNTNQFTIIHLQFKLPGLAPLLANCFSSLLKFRFMHVPRHF